MPKNKHPDVGEMDKTVNFSGTSPENLAVSRDDIQNLLDVGTPLNQMITILGNRGLSRKDIAKILTDFASYN